MQTLINNLAIVTKICACPSACHISNQTHSQILARTNAQPTRYYGHIQTAINLHGHFGQNLTIIWNWEVRLWCGFTSPRLSSSRCSKIYPTSIRAVGAASSGRVEPHYPNTRNCIPVLIPHKVYTMVSVTCMLGKFGRHDLGTVLRYLPRRSGTGGSEVP